MVTVDILYVFPRSISKLKRDHRREINKEMAARAAFFSFIRRLTSDPAANEIRARPRAAMLLEGLFHVAHLWQGRSQ